MARSDKLRIGVVEESVHGTTPGSPTVLLVEAASQSFANSAPKVGSDIIRSDNRLKGLIPVNRAAAGGYSGNLVYPTASQGMWELIRAGLNSAETAQATNANTCAITIAQTTVTRGAGSFVSDGFAIGDIVKIANATNAADNRYGLVTNSEALTLTLQLADSATWAASDADVTVKRGARMIDNNATTERAFSVEICWLDISKMQVGKGMVVNSLDWGFAMGSPSTFGVGFVGRDLVPGEMSSETVGIAGASYTAATASPVFGPNQSIYVVIGGVSYPFRSLGISVTRGARVGHSISGGAVADRVTPGGFTCTLRGSCYYAVNTLLTANTAGTETTLWVVMEDGAGKALGFSLGTVLLQSADVQTAGRGSDEMVNLTFEAANNTTRDATIAHFRFQ